MIEKTSSFKTSDGAVHETIEAAQVAELKLISRSADGEETAEAGPRAEWIVENKAAILAVLSTKARKPRVSKSAKASGVKNAAKGPTVGKPS